MRSFLPQSADRLSLWLLDHALVGLPPLLSAPQLAATYGENSRYAHNEARIDALVRWEVSKNFTAGFVTGLAAMVTLPVALPANLGAVWLLQARMAAALAQLRGHALDEPWVQSMVLLSLTGGAAPEVLRHAGVHAGEWAARRLIAQVSEQALQAINRRVGFRLLATSAGRGAVNVSRLIPVAGAAVGGPWMHGARGRWRAPRGSFLRQGICWTVRGCRYWRKKRWRWCAAAVIRVAGCCGPLQ